MRFADLREAPGFTALSKGARIDVNEDAVVRGDFSTAECLQFASDCHFDALDFLSHLSQRQGNNHAQAS